MMQATKPKLLLHKLSLGTCCLALTSPLRAAPGAKDEVAKAAPAVVAPPAKRFGNRSKWVIGVEGVANFQHNTMPALHSSFQDADGKPVRLTTTGSSDSTSLFAPRLGVDWFVFEHVSVGLGARYNQGTTRQTTQTEGAAGSGSGGSSSSMQNLSVSPRIGVAFASAAGFGVWGRAALDEGTTWYTTRMSGGSSGALAGLGGGASTQTHWSGALGATIEALGTYTPRDDLVLMAGPWLSKTFATFQDANDELQAPDETDIPPAYGLTVGAGLFL